MNIFKIAKRRKALTGTYKNNMSEDRALCTLGQINDNRIHGGS